MYQIRRLSSSSRNYDCDIIVLVDTLFFEDVLPSELKLNNYNVYRDDRSASSSDKSRGEGVLIGAHRELSSKQFKHQSSTVEQLFVEMKINFKSTIVGSLSKTLHYNQPISRFLFLKQVTNITILTIEAFVYNLKFQHSFVSTRIL